MTNVSAVQNWYNGIYLYLSTDTTMTNVFVADNGYIGIHMWNSTDTSMTNVSAAHNWMDGIGLDYSTNTNVTNVSAAHNGDDGIDLHRSSNISMMNVSAIHNWDIGIHLYYCTDTIMLNVSAVHNGDIGIYLYQSTDTNMINVSAEHNHHNDIAMINTANTYIVNTKSLITAYNTTNVVLNDTSFSNMFCSSIASSISEPTSLPAVITLYSSTLIIRDCNFTRNNISSIKTIGPTVTMSGKVLFHNNTAYSGTVLISAKRSLLIVPKNSKIHFQNNYTINYGGVFYISTEESYETSMSLHRISLNSMEVL